MPARESRAWGAFVRPVALLLLIDALAGVASATTPTPRVAITPDAGSIVVSWLAVTGAAAFEIMRTPDPIRPPVRLGSTPPSVLSYRDTQVGNSPVYYYQVVTVGADGSRAATQLFQFMVPPTARSPAVTTGSISISRAVPATASIARQLAALKPGPRQAPTIASSSGSATAPPVAQALPPPALTATIPSPHIDSLGVSHGAPADVVELYGENLIGPNPPTQLLAPVSEVHYVLGSPWPEFVAALPNTVGFAAHPNSDTNLHTVVPSGYAGVPAAGLDGHIYVKRRDGLVSNSVAFHFDPQIDCAKLPVPPKNPADSQLNYPWGADPGMPPGWSKIDLDLYGMAVQYFQNDLQVYESTSAYFLVGYKGDDLIYGHYQLYNGWYLADAGVINLGGYNAPTVVDSGLGGPVPYLKIHVWTDIVNTYVKYQPYFLVCGPLGLPYDNTPVHAATAP